MYARSGSLRLSEPFAERSRCEPATGLGAMGFDSAQQTAPNPLLFPP